MALVVLAPPLSEIEMVLVGCKVAGGSGGNGASGGKSQNLRVSEKPFLWTARTNQGATS